MAERKTIQPPTIKNELRAREGRRWVIIIMYLLAALIISAAVVFLGRWIYRSTTHENTKKGTSVTQVQQQTPKQPVVTGTGKTNDQSAPSGTATPNSLPNNGPGNLVAVFVVSAVAAGSLHYVVKRRQGA